MKKLLIIFILASAYVSSSFSIAGCSASGCGGTMTTSGFDSCSCEAGAGYVSCTGTSPDGSTLTLTVLCPE